MESSHTSSLQCTTQPRGNGGRHRTGIPPQGAARDMATRGDPSPDISAWEEDPVSRWGARTSWRGSIGTSSTKFSSVELSSLECAACVVEISRINTSKIFLFTSSTGTGEPIEGRRAKIEGEQVAIVALALLHTVFMQPYFSQAQKWRRRADEK